MSMIHNRALTMAQGAVILCISSDIAEAVADKLEIWNYRVVSPERFIPDGKYDEVMLVEGTLEKLSRHDRFMAELKLKTLASYAIVSPQGLNVQHVAGKRALGTAPKDPHEDEIEKHLDHFRAVALGLSQKESDALAALKFNEMSACKGSCIRCKTCHAVNRATDKFAAMSREDRLKILIDKHPAAVETYGGGRRHVFTDRD